ncbi:hypothetical protein DPMN_125177 [Dreissena polymorpha]|uniref:Uncharacterized protein n=1 Tax=Dreissena polymorpha TaxID=45954 RepID=A0A9D4GX12_DREPO|nr:hypothetical protein DPMN_125177 [Dreissena polymorpha]
MVVNPTTSENIMVAELYDSGKVLPSFMSRLATVLGKSWYRSSSVRSLSASSSQVFSFNSCEKLCIFLIMLRTKMMMMGTITIATANSTALIVKASFTDEFSSSASFNK